MRLITNLVRGTQSGHVVRLADLKRKLRLDHKELDETILQAMDAAARWAEDQCLRTLYPQVTYTYKLSGWPHLTYTDYYAGFITDSPVRVGVRVVPLPRPPLVSVQSVKYYDTTATQVTVSASNYRVHSPTIGQGSIEFDEDFDLPDLDVRVDAVEIAYTGGWNTRAAIPPQIIEAVKFYAAWLVDGDEKDEQAAVRILHNAEWGAYA